MKRSPAQLRSLAAVDVRQCLQCRSRQRDLIPIGATIYTNSMRLYGASRLDFFVLTQQCRVVGRARWARLAVALQLVTFRNKTCLNQAKTCTKRGESLAGCTERVIARASPSASPRPSLACYVCYQYAAAAIAGAAVWP
jgi:hypothetical protein